MESMESMESMEHSTVHTLYSPEYLSGNLFSLRTSPISLACSDGFLQDPLKRSDRMWGRRLQSLYSVFYGYEPFNYFGIL